MAVFGIGYKYHNEHMHESFYNNEVACMGHEPKNYSYFVGLFNEIKNGDIIFLKAVDKSDKKMEIKAVGIAKKPKFEYKDDIGYGINVDWKNYDPNTLKWIDVTSDGGWHQRISCIHKEYDKRIINKIMELLK